MYPPSCDQHDCSPLKLPTKFRAFSEYWEDFAKFRCQLPSRPTANLGCCVQARYDDDEEEDGPAADPQLEGGMPLPIRLAAEFPPDLTAIPLEDIDPYYQNKKVPTGILYFGCASQNLS